MMTIGKVQTQEIKAGHLYFMGSSDSPSMVRAKLHGAPSDPMNWDVYHVSVRPVSGEWDSDANWRAAEEYGNVGGCIATKLLEIDRCRGASLAELVADKRFVVVSMKLVEECARS